MKSKIRSKESIEQAQHLDSWRVFRIISEFVDGFETLTTIGPSVSIFGSARTDTKSPYYKMATDVAKKIAEKGYAVITGGGPGIMAAANKGAQLGKGASCGLGIDLPFETGANSHIDEKYNLHFRYFFVRKVMFMRYAQAFVVLPGGYGTLDELFEALTLIQTKKVQPFPVYLMGSSYWNGLIEWLKSVVITNNNLSPEDLTLFTITDDPEEVVTGIEAHYQASCSISNF